MFGMQYMIAGAYAYRDDQHVRVDVIYSKLSPRGKAIGDLISSVFFFIFTAPCSWTGWRFAADAIADGEISFTEWGIQYWPVKLTIPIGAALLLLQGVVRADQGHPDPDAARRPEPWDSTFRSTGSAS